MTKEVLMNVIKGTARSVDFMDMIREQHEFIRQAKNIAGTKPSKVEQAYIEEQDIKLHELENIVRRWVREAFHDEEETYANTEYWHKIEKNYNIRVFVEKKEK